MIDFLKSFEKIALFLPRHDGGTIFMLLNRNFIYLFIFISPSCSQNAIIIYSISDTMNKRRDCGRRREEEEEEEKSTSGIVNKH